MPSFRLLSNRSHHESARSAKAERTPLAQRIASSSSSSGHYRHQALSPRSRSFATVLQSRNSAAESDRLRLAAERARQRRLRELRELRQQSVLRSLQRRASGLAHEKEDEDSSSSSSSEVSSDSSDVSSDSTDSSDLDSSSSSSSSSSDDSSEEEDLEQESPEEDDRIDATHSKTSVKPNRKKLRSKRKRVAQPTSDRSLPLKKQHRALQIEDQEEGDVVDVDETLLATVEEEEEEEEAKVVEQLTVSSVDELSAEDRLFFGYALMDPDGNFMKNPLYLALEPEVSVADDADLDIMALQLPVHSTGCARTEGYRKMSGRERAQFRYVNKDQLASVEITADAKRKQSSRSVRARARETSVTLQQANETMQSTLLSYNRLKSRGKRIKFQKSHIHNWGLYAMEPIQAHEMVIEYIGEIVRSVVGDLREARYERQGIGSSYMFRINEEYIIDATKNGNRARFINHSCDPNCYAKVINVLGEEKIVIYAKKDIEMGQEISYDYKFPVEDGSIPCLCGSQICRGTLN